ncbi:MAG: peptidylprolyl isomerase [Pseudomonadota bacterium]
MGHVKVSTNTKFAANAVVHARGTEMETTAMRGLAFSALALATALAGCSSSGSDVGQVITEKPVIADQPVTTGVPDVQKINKAGGTRISLLVNNTPITSNDIKRRAAFVRLRKMKGNANQIATDELIEEAMKMEEAKRIRTVASQESVDAAYVNFAKRNKMPVHILTKVLNDRGVTKPGFQQFIKAQMSWQRAVGARFRAEGRSTTANNGYQSWLAPAGTEGATEKEYTLQQIVFTIPAAQRGQILNRRKAEANQFRSRISGCENAKQLAASVKDVSVKDLGRVRQHEMPPEWAKEVQTLEQGKVTRTKVTAKGVEMLALCKERDVKAATNVAAAGGDAFGGDDLRNKMTALEKKYLDELKERAVIKRW